MGRGYGRGAKGNQDGGFGPFGNLGTEDLGQHQAPNMGARVFGRVLRKM